MRSSAIHHKIPESHIVVELQEDPMRWYDNPDISDFMFVMFNLVNFTTICLHTYDRKAKRGLSKFELIDGK